MGSFSVVFVLFFNVSFLIFDVFLVDFRAAFRAICVVFLFVFDLFSACFCRVFHIFPSRLFLFVVDFSMNSLCILGTEKQ